MAWQADSERRSRLPSNWQSLRLEVLRRDRYRCQHRDYPHGPKCMARANQVDHIQRGDDHSLKNLQALCRTHHALKSSREGVEARQAKAQDASPYEAHPSEALAKLDSGAGEPLDPWGVTPSAPRHQGRSA